MVLMLNVSGIVWRIQKSLIKWTVDNAANATPIPQKSKRMARMAFLVSRASSYLTIPDVAPDGSIAEKKGSRKYRLPCEANDAN
jgi:hypothetical protein